MATREAENWSVSVDGQWTAVEYVFSTAVAPGFLYAHFKGRRPQRLEPARKKSLDIFDTPGELYIHYCCLGFQPARK